MKRNSNQTFHQPLDLLKLKADVANKRMNNFQQQVAEAITDLVFKNFNMLDDMEAEHIHQLGNIISKHACSMTFELDKLYYEIKRH